MRKWFPSILLNAKGGYGKVRKVHIEGMDIVPKYIPFAKKVSKAINPHEGTTQRSIEALVCPLNHSDIIKFFAIHSRTNEAYSLWWNGRHLNQLSQLDQDVLTTIEWYKMKKAARLLKEKQKQLSLFQRHKAKLASALVYVANFMHKSRVLHNDLSPIKR